ncbi:MAG TPA: peptidylprolyl isomerase [Anaerolineales bacterium]|nr:peptidylprolyl isomerase [Anaerolineales bacterium]
MAKQSPNPKLVTKKHIARLERERRQVNIIRGIAIGGIVVVLALLLYGYLQANVLFKRAPVAEIDGTKIVTGEWQERVRLERVSLYNQLSQYQFFQQNFGMDTTQQQQEIMLSLNSTTQLGDRVLNTMIDEVLLRKEAENRGITVSAEELDTYIQEAYEFYVDGTPSPTVTPTELVYPTLSSQQLTVYPATSTPTLAPTSTVAPTTTADPAITATATGTVAPPTPTFVPELPTASPTPYTLEGYEKRFGETLDQFKTYEISERTLRSVYEIEILRNKMMDEISKDEPQTEVQVLARHILLDTETEALAAYKLLQQGVDFAKIARESSKDTGSGAIGGELSWAPVSNYVPEFAEAVSNQEIGVIGEPVKTEFGYHIIQVIAREELPLTASQFDQKKQTIYNEWITAAREAADVTIFDIWMARVPTEPVLQQ